MILLRKARNQVCDARTKRRRKGTHHSIVKQARHASRKDEHVARMRIAVEKTVVENLFVNEFGDVLGELRRIDTGPLKGRQHP